MTKQDCATEVCKAFVWSRGGVAPSVKMLRDNCYPPAADALEAWGAAEEAPDAMGEMVEAVCKIAPTWDAGAVPIGLRNLCAHEIPGRLTYCDVLRTIADHIAAYLAGKELKPVEPTWLCRDCQATIKWPGRCPDCAQEESKRQIVAARVARLREEIARRMESGMGCCVQRRDGRVGSVILVDDINHNVVVAGIDPCGVFDRCLRWPLSDLAGTLGLEEGK